jgi:hypothetical protein
MLHCTIVQTGINTIHRGPEFRVQVYFSIRVPGFTHGSVFMVYPGISVHARVTKPQKPQSSIPEYLSW